MNWETKRTKKGVKKLSVLVKDGDLEDVLRACTEEATKAWTRRREQERQRRERHDGFASRKASFQQRDEQVINLVMGGMSQAQAARQFGISPTRVHEIVSRYKWKRYHLEYGRLRKEGLSSEDVHERLALEGITI